MCEPCTPSRAVIASCDAPVANTLTYTGASQALVTAPTNVVGGDVVYAVKKQAISILMKVLLGKVKEVKIGTWVIGLLFLLMFCVSR